MTSSSEQHRWMSINSLVLQASGVYLFIISFIRLMHILFQDIIVCCVQVTPGTFLLQPNFLQAIQRHSPMKFQIRGRYRYQLIIILGKLSINVYILCIINILLYFSYASQRLVELVGFKLGHYHLAVDAELGKCNTNIYACFK